MRGNLANIEQNHLRELARCVTKIHFRWALALALAIIDSMLDIGTELSIIVIPIRLLWPLRIKQSQKMILGIFLCLNSCMVVTSGLRLSGIKFRGTFDEVWILFWQYIQACTAITMLSITTFRSVFIGPVSRRNRRQKPWHRAPMHTFKRKKLQQVGDITSGLPGIPSATLTGVHTLIRDGKEPTSGRAGDWEENSITISRLGQGL